MLPDWSAQSAALFPHCGGEATTVRRQTNARSGPCKFGCSFRQVTACQSRSVISTMRGMMQSMGKTAPCLLSRDRSPVPAGESPRPGAESPPRNAAGCDHPARADMHVQAAWMRGSRLCSSTPQTSKQKVGRGTSKGASRGPHLVLVIYIALPAVEKLHHLSDAPATRNVTSL